MSDTQFIREPFATYLPGLKFVWGSSALPNVDCIGIVIAYLRYQGKHCPWEADVRREYTTFEAGMKHMLSENFVPDDDGEIFLLNTRPYAHIGFIENEIAYHITLEGLRQESTIAIKNRFRYMGQ